ncbi:5476_t:CDS:2 [Ambispora gerdemannii]|uniref:5476_t:CDS:1 n=1 Tax=Ambispora gerdemannii TaxID=144530 RepID=A0A9N8ZMS5_9GLOM|nr:5476_t:CDS:2 [Ambispora gerdemannii]
MDILVSYEHDIRRNGDILSDIAGYCGNCRHAVTSQKTQRFAVKSIFLFVVFVLLAFLASVSYFGFYMFYVPKISHVRPVYMQYQKDASPTALINFTPGHNFLTADQAYDVTIDLHVPNSERNVKLGNFMVYLELNSAKKNNETVQRSSRSAILHKQSNLLRSISTIWRLPTLLLGWAKEDQMLHVKMLENMIEDPDKPISDAYITIDEPFIETYEVKIRLDAHFKGLRYFMYYHPYVTGTTFTVIFLFWECLFCFVAWKMLVTWWQTQFPGALENRPRIAAKRNDGINGDDESQNGDGVPIEEDWETVRHDDGEIDASEDKENTTEAESESERSHIGVSNVDTQLNTPTSPEASYTTESYTTEDDDQSVVSGHSGIVGSRIPGIDDDDSIGYDDGQGSITPTTRSRRTSTSNLSLSNAVTDDDDDYERQERPIVGTSTSRVPTTGSRPYNRRVTTPGAGVGGGADSDTNVGNNNGPFN